MSGGVDSTMAAYLLKKQGYEVHGVTMKIYGGEKRKKVVKNACYGPGEAQDIAAAAKAARMLGITHEVIDLRAEYKKIVLDYFKKEYISGRTPNPCIVCNAKIKFGWLLKKSFSKSKRLGLFATGHYVRIKFDRTLKQFVLLKGLDKIKDQSYFLYRLSPSQLGHILTPLGSWQKQVLKKFASRHGFAEFAKKPESQDFYDCHGQQELLSGGLEGNIVNFKGEIIGKHQGIVNYTVGQRKNLKIGGLKEPYYVLAIKARQNIIIAGPKNEVYSTQLVLSDLNWIVPLCSLSRAARNNLQVKVRSSAPAVGCTVELRKNNQAILILKRPQFAVAPGQSAVFYSGQLVIGGGIISKIY